MDASGWQRNGHIANSADDDDDDPNDDISMDMDMDDTEEEEESQQSQSQSQQQPQQSQQQPDHERLARRGSMSEEDARLRRAEIKSILQDTSIEPFERRRSIQFLMDGRRNSMGGASSRRSSGAGASVASLGSPDVMEGSDPPQDMGMTMGNMGMDMNMNIHATTTTTGPPQNGATDLEGRVPQDHPHPPTCIITMDGFAHGVSHTAGNEQAKLAETSRPPCTHYKRHCTIIAPCCGAAFGCRICHDDCPVLPPKIDPMIPKRRYARSSSLPSSFTSMDTPEETHHNIDRFAMKEVICRLCFTRQSAKSNKCININCSTAFGEYHCATCNLWMSNEEKPYHCEFCGFCRVGGAEHFLHCHDCGMCIDKSLYSNHNCKIGKYKSNCPVCQEYLFSSRSASHEMPCGHAIHWDCFRQLAAHDSRCPVCKKTAETTERMMPTWDAMAAGVDMQPVPPELSRVVNINCNDCEKQDAGRAWHFLGVQCRNCSSFNTVVDRIVLTGEEAHDFLTAMEFRRIAQEPQPEESDGQQPRPTERRRFLRRRSNHT